MEKHSFYFRMLDSFQSSECPACSFLSDSIEKYFDDLLYEGAADFGFIRNFRKENGFCNFHAYKLASYKNGLAAASLFRYLVRDRLEEFQSGNFPQQLYAQRKCLACDFTFKTEKNYLSTFCEFLDDPELRDAFLQSGGLCLPHFAVLSGLLHGKLPPWLLEFQISQYEKLKSQLENYLDFQNYSLGGKRPDLTYEEQLVYQKATRLFSGYEGMKFIE